MPPLSSTSLNSPIARYVPATNTTGNALKVVCAWPVSGQYGPGSRALYYIVIAACVFARKEEWLWLRKPCLAVALLFPAVAALHGIVLAAVHVDGAVDMDVFGAFQLCSIGILATTVTARLSRTYFEDPSRNIVFLWTGLVLAGLLGLTVEFFRSTASDCTHDGSGEPISPDPGKFAYDTTCGLTCSIGQGPFSPLRGGSTNNIYVIPAPDSLTFNTATLLAAACCIPAILSLISTWTKILKEKYYRSKDKEAPADAANEGPTGAANEELKGPSRLIRRVLKGAEIPIIGAAVLAILIIGEKNFFSRQVQYQTEPIASIGQWAPIVGTGLAVLGSLYLLYSTKTPGARDLQDSVSNDAGGTSSEATSTANRPAQAIRSWPVNTVIGVARSINRFVKYFTTPSKDLYGDSDYKNGKAQGYPETPGEIHVNPSLSQTRDKYNLSQDADGNVTPLHREQCSRSASRTRSTAFKQGVEAGPSTPRDVSPRCRTPRAATVLNEQTSFEPQSHPPSAGASPTGERPRRRDTLGVPPTVYGSSGRRSPPGHASI